MKVKGAALLADEGGAARERAARAAWRWPTLLCGAALLWRLGLCWAWGWDGLYGQDAFAYWEQAQAIAAGLPRGVAPPATFFWPNGYPGLVALGLLVLGPNPAVAQAVSLVAGALLPPLAYGLARELWPGPLGARAGRVAGLALVVAGQPLLSSLLVMADVPALAWATAAAWLGARAWRGARPAPWLVAAGATAGLAVVTRWLYLLALPGLVGYGLVRWRAARAPGGLLALPLAAGLTLLLPQLWLSAMRPGSLAHPWLLNWHPAHALQREFVNADGHFLYEVPPALFNLYPAFHPAYLFPLLGLAALVGLAVLWRRRDGAALVLLVGWGLPPYLFLAAIPYENFRFGLTHYLPALLLAALGVAWLWQSGPRPRAGVAALLALSLLGMALWGWRMSGDFVRLHSASKAIVRQAAAQLPPEATLLTVGFTQLAAHYTPLRAADLFFEDEATLRGRLRRGEPLFLLVDVANLEQQWRGRPPEAAYHFLRDGPGLSPLARWGGVTLFAVGDE